MTQGQVHKTPDCTQIKSQILNKTDLEVNIQTSPFSGSLELTELLFSEINFRYSEQFPKANGGILCHYSINDLANRLNNFKKVIGTEKLEAPAILKGLYKGGIKGQYCTKSVNFMFFDIDVKEQENTALNNPKNNADVFEHLRQISVLTWRSNSGKGIAGLLYVPELSQYTHETSVIHKKVGEAITRELTAFLKAKTGFEITFDNTQSAFRQVRFLAEQKNKRAINPNPTVFYFTTKEVQKKTFNGCNDYTFSDNRLIKGGLREQYNAQNNILDIAQSVGFSILPNQTGVNVRVKNPISTSMSSGVINLNDGLYYNYSSSVSQKRVLDAYALALAFIYNYDTKALNNDLKAKGYQTIKPAKEDLKQALNQLQNVSEDRERQIFSLCYDLKNASLQDKKDFIKEAARTENEKRLFSGYLGFKELLINYDHTFQVSKYVSEVVPDILKLAATEKKILVKAETGLGKTTGFLKELEKSGKRFLLIAPLTVIVEQLQKDFPKAVCLTSDADADVHQTAISSSFVVATYEQGVKYLSSDDERFVFVIIDEVHQLITSQSYKDPTIRMLTEQLSKYTCIGLTGTPSNLFKNLGFKMVNVEKKDQQKQNIVSRVFKEKPEVIILNHLKTVTGKAIFLLNEINTLKGIKKTLLDTKSLNYKESDILVLHSDARIKKGENFKSLTENRRFLNDVKIILTTSIIEEGVSIDQEGFSDIVSIETNYNAIPSSHKQFHNRNRNKDDGRTHYHYRKIKNAQEPKNWSLNGDYNATIKKLKAEPQTEYKDSFRHLAADGKYYFENGRINTFFVAYECNLRFFQSLNKEEFDFYVEENYNINYIHDSKYILSSISNGQVETIQEYKKEIKSQLMSYFIDRREEVRNAIFAYTQDAKLKKSIKEFAPFTDEWDDFIIDNLKHFEDLEKRYFRIKQMDLFLEGSEADINEMLFTKGKPTDSQKFNNLMTLWGTFNLLEFPKTKADLTNKKKIENFYKQVGEKKVLTIQDIHSLWSKQNINNKHSHKSGILIEFLSHFYSVSKANDIYTFTR